MKRSVKILFPVLVAGALCVALRLVFAALSFVPKRLLRLLRGEVSVVRHDRSWRLGLALQFLRRQVQDVRCRVAGQKVSQCLLVLRSSRSSGREDPLLVPARRRRYWRRPVFVELLVKAAEPSGSWR